MDQKENKPDASKPKMSLEEFCKETGGKIVKKEGTFLMPVSNKTKPNKLTAEVEAGILNRAMQSTRAKMYPKKISLTEQAILEVMKNRKVTREEAERIVNNPM